MASRWSKVADEIEALRNVGAPRTEAAADPFTGPVIETTHRVVSSRPARPVAAIEAPPAVKPEEYRFRENGRLVNTGKGESFLAQGRKSKGWV